MNRKENGAFAGSSKKTSPLGNGNQRQSFDLRSLVSDMFSKKGPPTKLPSKTPSPSKSPNQQRNNNQSSSPDKENGKSPTKKGKHTPAVIPVIKRHSETKNPRLSPTMPQRVQTKAKPSVKGTPSKKSSLMKPKINKSFNSSRSISPSKTQQKSSKNEISPKPKSNPKNLSQKTIGQFIQKKKAVTNSNVTESALPTQNEKETTPSISPISKPKASPSKKHNKSLLNSEKIDTSLNNQTENYEKTSADKSHQSLAADAEIMNSKQGDIPNKKPMSSKKQALSLNEEKSNKAEPQPSFSNNISNQTEPKKAPRPSPKQVDLASSKKIPKSPSTNKEKRAQCTPKTLKEKKERIKASSKSPTDKKSSELQIHNKSLNNKSNQSPTELQLPPPSMENGSGSPQNISASKTKRSTEINENCLTSIPTPSKNVGKSPSTSRKRSRSTESKPEIIASKEIAIDEGEDLETNNTETADLPAVEHKTENLGKKKSRLKSGKTVLTSHDLSPRRVVKGKQKATKPKKDLSEANKIVHKTVGKNQEEMIAQDKCIDESSEGTKTILNSSQSIENSERDKPSQKSNEQTRVTKKIFDVEYIDKESSFSDMIDDDADSKNYSYIPSKNQLDSSSTSKKDIFIVKKRESSYKLDVSSTAMESKYSKSSVFNSNKVIIDLSTADDFPSQKTIDLEAENIILLPENQTREVKNPSTNDESKQCTESFPLKQTLTKSDSVENNHLQETPTPKLPNIQNMKETPTCEENKTIEKKGDVPNPSNITEESVPSRRKRKKNPKYFDNTEETSPQKKISPRRSTRKRKLRSDENFVKDVKLEEEPIIVKISLKPKTPSKEQNLSPHNTPIVEPKRSNTDSVDESYITPTFSQNDLSNASIASSDSKRDYGLESERTCPYCNKVFSIVTGLAYHVEHKICKHSDQRKIKTLKSIEGTTPFQKLLGGERFVTKFGVVKVVKDDRAPEDLNSTVIPKKIGILAHNYKRKKERVVQRKESMRMYAAKISRRRRNKLKELWLKRDSGCYTQKNIWPHYCTLAKPKDLLSGIYQRKRDQKFRRKPVQLENHPWLQFGENPLVPHDSYPDRMVECVLVKDEREHIMNLAYDSQRYGRSSTLSGAVSSIKKCIKMEQDNCDLYGVDDGMNFPKVTLYLRRETLTNPYNPYIPAYKCYRCGTEFDSRPCLKQHLEGLSCERRRDALIKATKLRIEEVDKAINEVRIKPPQQPNRLVPPGEKPKPRIKLKENPNIPGWIRFDPSRSSIYPEVFKFQGFRRGSNNRHFMQKIFEESGPSRKKQRKSKVRHTTLHPMYLEVEVALFGKAITRTIRPGAPRIFSAWSKDGKKRRRSSTNANTAKNEQDMNDIISLNGEDQSVTNTLISFDTANSEQASHPSVLNFGNFTPTKFNLNQQLNNESTVAVPGDDTIAPLSKQKPNVSDKPSNKNSTSLENKEPSESNNANDNADPVTPTTVDVSPTKKKRRKRSPVVNPKPPGPPVIVDMMVLVEEVDTGRYPSIKRFHGEHSEICVLCRGGTGSLFSCVFCSNTEHLECVRTKLTIREPEPEDDFMCHRCIQIVLARRNRAEKRRQKKREEWLGKAGIMTDPNVAANLDSIIMSPTTNLSPTNPLPVNPAIAMLNPAALNPVVQAAATVERELVWNQSEFDSHVKTYDKCPTGGPGGLICCGPCSASYSRLLTNTAKEMETQTVAKLGREVSELVELLRDAQLRLQQAVDVSNANECRRNLLERNEIESTSTNNNNQKETE